MQARTAGLSVDFAYDLNVRPRMIQHTRKAQTRATIMKLFHTAMLECGCLCEFVCVYALLRCIYFAFYFLINIYAHISHIIMKTNIFVKTCLKGNPKWADNRLVIIYNVKLYDSQYAQQFGTFFFASFF